MELKAHILRVLTIAMLAACLVPAADAQWSWKDRDGRRIFSDQPPPSDVPDKDILKRPQGTRSAAVTTASETSPSSLTSATSSTPSATASAPRISGKDSDLEKRKREQEAKEAAQKKAEAEKIAASRKDNCERAKLSKASFDSGVRIATVNAQGQREIMSDAAKAAETKRLQDIINSECN